MERRFPDTTKAERMGDSLTIRMLGQAEELYGSATWSAPFSRPLISIGAHTFARANVRGGPFIRVRADEWSAKKLRAKLLRSAGI